MKILGFEIGKKAPIKKAERDGNIIGTALFSVGFDGEKNLGELGPIIDYKPQYNLLRLRSWQSFYESEITQTVINKYLLWVLGSGLKLKAEPNKVVLKSEGIKLKSEEFNEITEARFKLYAESTDCDHSKMVSLNELSREATKNAIIGGDVLVVLRYEDNNVTVQLIDGQHLTTPFGFQTSGNEIRNGIEINDKGEHIAFHVTTKTFGKYERIEAKKNGIVQAFLLYGLKYRLDNTRGLPFISAVLETLKKLERYKEATVGSAEESAKISYQIVHQNYSDGENPMVKQFSKAFSVDEKDDNPVDINGTKLADTVAATTNKMALNMPKGAELKTIQSSNRELYFKDFYMVNSDIICAALGIPPNVAFSKYDSNFSASRAALKDWEHTITVARASYSIFYKHIYYFWLQTEILKNKIPANGYLSALNKKDTTVLNAYSSARFVGPGVPHIDPLKEVKAEREKLGALGINLPLTTLEDATEVLMSGDSDSNMEQFSEELKESKKLGLVTDKPIQSNSGSLL